MIKFEGKYEFMKEEKETLSDFVIRYLFKLLNDNGTGQESLHSIIQSLEEDARKASNQDFWDVCVEMFWRLASVLANPINKEVKSINLFKGIIDFPEIPLNY